jgi:hypothetical protein
MRSRDQLRHFETESLRDAADAGQVRIVLAGGPVMGLRDRDAEVLCQRAVVPFALLALALNARGNFRCHGQAFAYSERFCNYRRSAFTDRLRVTVPYAA